MNINYADSCNFKPIPSITPLDGYWQNSTWKFNMSEITAGASSQPSWQDIVLSGNGSLTLTNAKENGLNYLKLFGGTEQRNLPDNYIERQYTYMQEGSYLAVTNQSITSDYKIEFDFATTNLSTSLANYFGARASGVSAGGGFRVTKLSNQGVAMYGFDTTDAYESGANILTSNTRYKYVYENGTCKLSSNGTDVLTHTYTVNDTSTITAFGINAYTSNGTTFAASNLGIYCYGLKMWNGQGELVMDLVPAVQRGTVPVVGFYDTVSKTFKTATAGTFMAGAEAVPSPNTPMDIVSNNGVVRASINEFDANAITSGYFYNADLEWVANSSVYISDYMQVVKDKYTLILNRKASQTATVNIRVNLFNANKEIQSQIVIPIEPDATELTHEIDIPNNISYVRISTNPSMITISDFRNSKTIYTVGTVETVEVDTTGDTATAEMLLKVGDYKDVQSIIDGGVTRNIGIKALDGTENWDYAFARFTLNLSDKTDAKVNVLCNYFAYSSATSTNMPDLSIISYASRSIGVRYDRFTSVVQFKQWLADQYNAGKPVIIVYPLATATTESVTPQPLSIQAGTNIVEITQASIDNLPLEVSYKGVI